MQRQLEEVRAIRDHDLSYKKRKEIELIQAGKLSNVGFSGA